MSLNHVLKDWPFFIIALGSHLKTYLTVWGFISVFCSSPFVLVFSILMILFLLLERESKFWSQIIWFIYSSILFWLLGFLDIKEESVYEYVHACPSATWGSQRTTFRNRFFPWVLAWTWLMRLALHTFPWEASCWSPPLFHSMLFWLSGLPGGLCDLSISTSGFLTHCVRSAIWGSTESWQC